MWIDALKDFEVFKKLYEKYSPRAAARKADREADKRRLEQGFSSSKLDPKILLEALNTLRVHSAHTGVPMPTEGICHNIMYYLDTEHNLPLAACGSTLVLCYLFQGWGEHSGRFAYPVNEDYNYKSWEGPNLEKRQRLLEYTIARLEKFIEEHQEA